MKFDHKRYGRKEQYTEIGIRRLPCFRCGAKAMHQWNICADDNIYRPLCLDCDIELNELVLQWAGFPDWRIKIKRYRNKCGATPQSNNEASND